jgi:hypothetical protein
VKFARYNAVIYQPGTIDKKRVVKKPGALIKAEITRCKQVIREAFVDRVFFFGLVLENRFRQLPQGPEESNSGYKI